MYEQTSFRRPGAARPGSGPWRVGKPGCARRRFGRVPFPPRPAKQDPGIGGQEARGNDPAPAAAAIDRGRRAAPAFRPVDQVEGPLLVRSERQTDGRVGTAPGPEAMGGMLAGLVWCAALDHCGSSPQHSRRPLLFNRPVPGLGLKGEIPDGRDGCRPLALPRPWDFLAPGRDCYGTLADAPAMLANLPWKQQIAKQQVQRIVQCKPIPVIYRY
jgi:hypothetical protein